MQPGSLHAQEVLPTRQRTRAGAIVDFNAKVSICLAVTGLLSCSSLLSDCSPCVQQFTRALDAEAKELRSIHAYLSKTLKNLEVCVQLHLT